MPRWQINVNVNVNVKPNGSPIGDFPKTTSFFLGHLAARCNSDLPNRQRCVRLSAFTLGSAASRSAMLAGSCTASCVCALSNLIEPTARDPRASPRWRAPSARAIRCPAASAFRAPPHCHARTRIGAASSSCLAHHPIPTCPANAPARHDLLSVSLLLHPLSHVSSPFVLCPAGARHPARRPDALGQDDRRRRRRLQHLLL